MQISTIIFDVGGVLIDWDPRYLYRKIFKSEEEVSWFLENICTSEWNDEQDAGRSFEEATQQLILKHPAHRVPIEAWYSRWQETIRGPIHATVDVLHELKQKNSYQLLALTNWSAETFPWALENFHFLHWFEGIVVSGVEKCRKPDRKIYDILLNRFEVVPGSTLFIDDNIKNIRAAAELGLHTIHFKDPHTLKTELEARGLL